MAPVLSLPRIDIVIVNWNSGDHLSQCLRSIEAAESDGLRIGRVVVTDNHSGDQSLEKLNAKNLPLEVIRNAENRGFAAACNQGAEESDADYLLFLNPDTTLSPEALSKPVEFMETTGNERIGILGIQLVDETGAIARSCAKFPTAGRLLAVMMGLDRLFPRFFEGHFMTEWNHSTSREVDQVMGAFFLVRRSLFESLGEFDERFFLYYEDLDFSLRARKAGFGSYFFSGTWAYHKGKASSDLVKADRLGYLLRSRILFAYKHFGWWVGTGLALATLFLEPFFRFGITILRGSPRGVLETATGYMRLWMSLPDLILNRDKKGLRP